MSLSLPSSLFLLPLSKTLVQSSSTCTSRSLPIPNGYRISPRALTKKRRRLKQCQVATVEDVAEDVLLPREAEEVKEVEEKYDWKEEWYPLYLTAEVPEDAPLGLTVFHKQIVLYRDLNGVLRCHEDRCPHRLAKLSEGQLVDGRIECLYHGWQFEGNGKCVKIPQLPEGAKIPRAACVRTYEVRDSQGVVWVWMSDKNPPNLDKLPWFEHYAKPGFLDTSTIHELPYDHSILLENLMDPAHVPISHDRTDWTAKREDAQPLVMTVKERSMRGFSGQWGRSKNPAFMNSLSFQAPCVLQNNLQIVDKKGVPLYFSALFLCRPAGQGRSMLIVRFGASSRPLLVNLIPKWYFHQNACKVFEQDMGFLSSQNEVLIREKVPTKELYLNLKFSDTWVMEYRKWMDRVGSGMPYYIGHDTVSMPAEAAVVEQAPVGAAAAVSASMPAKGGVGDLYAPNPTNRYYRHVVHCKGCRIVVKRLGILKNVMRLLSLVAITAAILSAGRQWKVAMLALAIVLLGTAQVDSRNSFAGKRARTDGGRREDDWTCPNCGNVNFSFRTTCNMRNCTQSRPVDHNKSAPKSLQGPPPFTSVAGYAGSAVPSSVYGGAPYGSSYFNGSPLPPYDLPAGGSGYPYGYGGRLSVGSPYGPLHISGPPPYSGGSMLAGGMYGMPPLMDRYGMGMHMGHGAMGPSRPVSYSDEDFQKKPAGRDNDWICPNCGNRNFAFRNICNMRKCNTPRPGNQATKSENLKGSKPKMPEGSWTCEKCNNINYPFRTKCNRQNCGAEKPSEANEARELTSDEDEQ